MFKSLFFSIFLLLTFNSCISPIKLSKESLNKIDKDVKTTFSPTSQKANWAYFGTAISQFSWKYDTLTSWQNSNEMLMKASHQWLGVPSKDCVALHNPDFQQFSKRLYDFSQQLPSEKTLILFLGTHHLNNGNLLFVNDQNVTPQEFLDSLKPIKNKTYLLLDVCYAQKLDSLNWPTNIIPIYSSSQEEVTPEVLLERDSLNVKSFFLTHHYTVKKSLNLPYSRYSYLGLMYSHSLRRTLLNKENLEFRDIYQDMLQQQTTLHNFPRTVRLPTIP